MRNVTRSPIPIEKIQHNVEFKIFLWMSYSNSTEIKITEMFSRTFYSIRNVELCEEISAKILRLFLNIFKFAQAEATTLVKYILFAQ